MRSKSKARTYLDTRTAAADCAEVEVAEVVVAAGEVAAVVETCESLAKTLKFSKLSKCD